MNKETLMDLWDTITWNNIPIMGVPEKEKGAESIFEGIMTINSPNLRKEMDIQIQEAQKNPKYSKCGDLY